MRNFITRRSLGCVTEASHPQVAILLHRLVALAGRDLAEEVDAKMAVNRARRWYAAGDGTGGHV